VLALLLVPGPARAAEPATSAAPNMTALADASPIINLQNDRRSLQCLAGRQNGHVELSGCVDAFTDQFWFLTSLANGFYRLRNRLTGLCLSLPAGAGNSSRAVMISCVDGISFAPEWWQPIAVQGSTTVFELRNVSTDKCIVALHENGFATSFTCTAAFNDQWWHFLPRG
jgi:hypothetical protein